MANVGVLELKDAELVESEAERIRTLPERLRGATDQWRVANLEALALKIRAICKGTAHG